MPSRNEIVGEMREHLFAEGMPKPGPLGGDGNREFACAEDVAVQNEDMVNLMLNPDGTVNEFGKSWLQAMAS